MTLPRFNLTLTDAPDQSIGPALLTRNFACGSRLAGNSTSTAGPCASTVSALSETDRTLTFLIAARRNLGGGNTLTEKYGSRIVAMESDWHAGSISFLNREKARRQVHTARITQIFQQVAPPGSGARFTAQRAAGGSTLPRHQL